MKLIIIHCSWVILFRLCEATNLGKILDIHPEIICNATASATLLLAEEAQMTALAFFPNLLN